MGTWEGASTGLLDLFHFYDKSGDREFVEIAEAFGEVPENITKISLVHAGFCGEAAYGILKEGASRMLGSDSNDVRYWAALELHRHQMLDLEFFKVFN